MKCICSHCLVELLPIGEGEYENCVDHPNGQKRIVNDFEYPEE